MTEPATNPLLEHGALPRFDAIRPEHVEPAITSVLTELGSALEDLEKDPTPTWEGLVEPLERVGDRLGFSWGVVGHLMGVRNSDALREAYEAMQPAVVELSLRQGQSPEIYAGLVALREGAGWEVLDAGQQRIVDHLILGARHAGVGLAGRERERFNEIQRELAELSTQFSNHVLDATKAYGLMLHDADRVSGMPDTWRALAAQSAREEGGQPQATADAGPWRVTLDYPSFGPLMEHCRARELRESVYRAYVTRASDGELDNAPIIDRILQLRVEEAELLGYESYADLSLSVKMAADVDAVEKLLEQLRTASYEAAADDLDALRDYAREQSGDATLEIRQWDVPFWAERLREHRFAYGEEELRPYFPLPSVLSGLFELAGELFGVVIEAADGETPVWCDDVRFFRVRDEDGRPIAAFYLDPYSRPGEKRGGAWMDECVGRSRQLAPPDEMVRLPVAYLVCNQAPPVGDHPSLMSFDEVRTLFHEFGHGLQHMLTRVDHGLASGIRNIEWDAVELPSQFMENWCYQRETIQRISGHVKTGEPLPDKLFEKVSAARTYRAGSDMLRQLYFALTDLALHDHSSQATETAFDVQRRIAEQTTIIPPLPEDRFLCSFGHIFAGGYAAGYYSYKWAEVLSADAFGAFEEAGLDQRERVVELGRLFRDTILALGGSRHPMDVFRRFRGREPSPDALLRHCGLESA